MEISVSLIWWTRIILSLSLLGSGVMKSAIGDLTDRTNRAKGYAFLPSECWFVFRHEIHAACQVVWALGVSSLLYVVIRSCDTAPIGIFWTASRRKPRSTPRPFPGNFLWDILAGVSVLSPLLGNRKLRLFCLVPRACIFQRGMFPHHSRLKRTQF